MPQFIECWPRNLGQAYRRLDHFKRHAIPASSAEAAFPPRRYRIAGFQTMIVSASRKFLFVHIPKTGGLSLEAMLQSYDEKAKRGVRNRIARQLRIPLPMKDAYFGRHDSLRLFQRLCVDCDLDEVASFAVIRNPYDHAVSHYNFLKQLPSHRQGQRVRNLSFAQYLALRATPANQVTETMRKDIWFLRLPDQTSFISDNAGRIIVRHLLRLENLAADWAMTAGEIGLPDVPLIHRNKGKVRKGRSHAEFYDPSTRALVEKIYARDFQNFGFEHELCA